MATEPADDDDVGQPVLHAGLAGSFLRLPHVAARRRRLRAHGARAAIYGIPFDATHDQQHRGELRPARDPRRLAPVPDLQRDV